MMSISSSSPLLVPHNKHKTHYPQQSLPFTSSHSSFLSIIPNLANSRALKSSSVIVSSSKSASNSVTENKIRHFKVGEYPPPPSPFNGYGINNKNNNNNNDQNSRNRENNSRNWDSNNKNLDNNSRNRDNNSRNRVGDNKNLDGNSRNRENNSRNRENNSRNRDSNSRNWDNNSKNRENNSRNRENNSRNWDNNSRNRDPDSRNWDGNSRNRGGDSRNRYNDSRDWDGDSRNRGVGTFTRSPVRVGVGGIDSNNKIKNINKKMENRNKAKAWASTVTESLSDLILKKQWIQALEVFDMLKEQPFYQPKEGTYMKLIVLLGRCGQPQHAQKLFDAMLEEGLNPTPQLYTALLSAYCRSNLIEKSFAILEKMKSLPLCQPDVYTYSILIKACVDTCHFDLVETLYSEMSERSIVPNTVTQNTVLSGYGKAGKFEEMEKVLSKMLGTTSSEPDVWTMNTIIGLFGNKGEIETMEKWYEKFRNFGIEPETRTFNILIGAYGKKKMYDKMSSVMEYMRKLSFPWTTSTYNNVIEAFADSGDARHMEHTFDQMRAEGIKADTKTFCCLIRGYANAGLFHKVISSAQLAGEMEIQENTSFYNAIIFACAKADDLVEMERVFRRMKEKHCQPDSTTYDVMVEVYRSQGMSDKVFDLEQEKEKTMTMFLDSGDHHSTQVEEESGLES